MKSIKSIADKCSNKINRLAASEEDLLSSGRLSGVIEEALQEIRNAAIKECFDTALNLNDGHEWPVSRAILALLDK